MIVVKRATSLREMLPALVRHRVPAGTESWPSVSELSNPAPAADGPSHSVWSRAHSQTHAAAAWSGSGVTFALNVAQPHDHTPARLNCVATNFAESASSLTISSQAAAGWRPARWPSPGEVVICISSAIRCEGIPIWVRWSTSPRRLWRIERLAAVGPSL